MEFNPKIAFDTFRERYLTHKDEGKIDNSSLPVGSPMFYYCKGCTILVATLPETHVSPIPRYCDACLPIAAHGLLDEFRKKALHP